MNYLDIDECSAALSYSLPLQEQILKLAVPSASASALVSDSSAVLSPSIKDSSSVIVEVSKVDDMVKYAPLENVDYGALASNLSGHGENKYYLTTAIAYTNGYPHMGHAYEVFFKI
jgi:hypothetical protein